MILAMHRRLAWLTLRISTILPSTIAPARWPSRWNRQHPSSWTLSTSSYWQHSCYLTRKPVNLWLLAINDIIHDDFINISVSLLLDSYDQTQSIDQRASCQSQHCHHPPHRCVMWQWLLESLSYHLLASLAPPTTMQQCWVGRCWHILVLCDHYLVLHLDKILFSCKTCFDGEGGSC